MVNTFCPSCGKPQDESILCSDCTKKEVAVGYEAPLIQVSEFNRMFHRGVWKHFDNIDDIIISRVQEALGTEGRDIEIDIPSFEFDIAPKQKTKFDVVAHIDGKEVPLHVKLSYMQCDFGQKQKTAYYEGIMQLRQPNDRVIDFMNKEMVQLAPKGVFITKTVDQKHGVDLYFTNKTHMNLLAQKIGGRFGAAVSTHPQLFSHNHQTSKDIYRLNILVSIPKFMAGDVISFDYPRKGNLTVLISSMGKIAQGQNLILGKQVGFELKNCEDIIIYKKQATTISTIHPEVRVLDPENYQEQVLANKDLPPLEVGDTVNIVKTPHGLYIVK